MLILVLLLAGLRSGLMAYSHKRKSVQLRSEAKSSFCWRRSRILNHLGHEAESKKYEMIELTNVIFQLGFLPMLLWTFWRNRCSLVRSAEQEIFLELLDDWPATYAKLPKQLLPVFEEARSLQKKQPSAFRRKLLDIATKIKNSTQQNITI